MQKPSTLVIEVLNGYLLLCSSYSLFQGYSITEHLLLMEQLLLAIWP